MSKVGGDQMKGNQIIHSNATHSPAVAKLLQSGHRKFQQLLGDTGQRFDDTYWDMRSLQKETVSGLPRYLRFSCFQNDQLLPSTFVEEVKCWILLRHTTNARMMWQSLQAAKNLWASLTPGQKESFSWSHVSEALLNEFEMWMTARYHPTTVHCRLSLIMKLIAFLAAHNICRPLYYVIQMPEPDSIAKLTLAGQEVNGAKLPTPRALQPWPPTNPG